MTTATHSETTQEELLDEATNRPVSTGKHFGLDFALFKNMGKTGNPFYSLTLSKSFKKAEGEFDERKVSLLLIHTQIIRMRCEFVAAVILKKREHPYLDEPEDNSVS